MSVELEDQWSLILWRFFDILLPTCFAIGVNRLGFAGDDGRHLFRCYWCTCLSLIIPGSEVI